jgi:hypothetical protein
MQGGGESAGSMYVITRTGEDHDKSMQKDTLCVRTLDTCIYMAPSAPPNKLNLGTDALDLPSYFDWKSDPPRQIRKNVPVEVIERKETTHLRQWHAWLA